MYLAATCCALDSVAVGFMMEGEAVSEGQVMDAILAMFDCPSSAEGRRRAQAAQNGTNATNTTESSVATPTQPNTNTAERQHS